jgi:hypothetical protein
VSSPASWVVAGSNLRCANSSRKLHISRHHHPHTNSPSPFLWLPALGLQPTRATVPEHGCVDWICLGQPTSSSVSLIYPNEHSKHKSYKTFQPPCPAPPCPDVYQPGPPPIFHAPRSSYHTSHELRSSTCFHHYFVVSLSSSSPSNLSRQSGRHPSASRRARRSCISPTTSKSHITAHMYAGLLRLPRAPIMYALRRE